MRFVIHLLPWHWALCDHGGVGECINRIVTGVISDVGMSSIYLVYSLCLVYLPIVYAMTGVQQGSPCKKNKNKKQTIFFVIDNPRNIICPLLNSLAHGWCGNDLKSVIFESVFYGLISWVLPVKSPPGDSMKPHWWYVRLSTLVKVMACFLPAPSHYLIQCWPSSLLPYGITRPQWVDRACYPLQWRHNGHDGISNHQPHDCLLNRLFRHRSKKTSKLRITGHCARNSPVTGGFPAQMASNAESVSIWWCHHAGSHCLGHSSGGRLNIKMPSYQYRDPHVKDKTVSPTVLSLTWESPYLGKTVFILRRGPGSLSCSQVTVTDLKIEHPYILTSGPNLQQKWLCTLTKSSQSMLDLGVHNVCASYPCVQ